MNHANLPELTPVMLKKIKHLSIVTLATKSKVSNLGTHPTWKTWNFVINFPGLENVWHLLEKWEKPEMLTPNLEKKLN